MFSKKESSFEKLEMLFWEFVDKYGEEGLEEILSNLDNLHKLGYSEELVKGDLFGPVVDGPTFHSVMRNVFAEDYQDFLRYAYGVRLRRIAYNTLPQNRGGRGQIFGWILDLPRGWPFTTFSYRNFMYLYALLEKLYFIQSGRKLGAEDILNIYFSGLDERLIFFLNEFDTVKDEDIPEPSKNYFQILKHVKYQNKPIRNMKQDLGYLVGNAINYYVGRLGGWESDVLKTLTYCSAVSDGRKVIIRDDVVRGFSAYFKLLNTDVTKYKVRRDVLSATNYDNFRAKITYYTLKFMHGRNP